MFRYITAFMKKEALWLVRHKAQMTFELLLPIIGIIPVLIYTAYILSQSDISSFAAITGTEQYFEFFCISIVFTIFSIIQEQTGNVLANEMWMGTLEQIWMAPVPKTFLMFGWLSIGLVKAVLNCIISLAILYAVFFFGRVSFTIYNVPLLLFSILLLMAISFAIGMVICSISLKLKQADAIIFFITGLIPIICGASYPITVLPQSIQIVAKLLPTTYAYDLIRHAFINTTTIFPIAVELVVLCVQTIIMIGIAIGIYKRVCRRVEECGTIYLM